MRTADELAELWATSFDRALAWSAEFPDIRRNILASRLPFHLAVTELEWAHETIKEASRIRAEGIVHEIGWPKPDWLNPRIDREVARFNAVHDWLNGAGPNPHGE